ncbi:MAG: hypothetical protein LBM75_01275 [Myxococcales bacterium]|jgi:hypothetical protein|nr:hypothetical protein [Myxococcales bacterium]
MKRIALALCSLILLLPAGVLAAVSPEKAGQLTAEMDSRKKELRDKEFGGKDLKEMSSSERVQYERKGVAIDKEVLKENNVPMSQYNTAMMRATKNSPAEKAREEHAKKIEADKKAAAEAEKKKAEEQAGSSESPQVEIERGDQKGGRSMTVEGGGVMVERGE